MEVQELISLLLGLVTACIGFFLKRMIRELDTSLPGSGHGRVVQSYYR